MLNFGFKLSQYDFEISGVYGFVVMLVIFIILPILLVIAPLSKYLGLKTFAKMFLKNPPLVVLPFVTDYVVGPVNGYGRCTCLNFCCWWRCCCWICCCTPCKYQKGTKIKIHRKMSIAKLLYSFILLLPMWASMIYAATTPNGGGAANIFLLVLIPIGNVAFVVVMSLGSKFGVVDLLDTKGNEAVNAEEIRMDKLTYTNDIDLCSCECD